MANHKSAEKRIRQSQARRLRNRVNKTQMKNAVRKVNEAVQAGSVDEAKEALRIAIPVSMKIQRWIFGNPSENKLTLQYLER